MGGHALKAVHARPDTVTIHEKSRGAEYIAILLTQICEDSVGLPVKLKLLRTDGSNAPSAQLRTARGT